MLQVKVEATSANVCVGFDVLGISLNLYNTFTFEKADSFKFKGFLEKYSNCENNLVYDAYKTVFEYANEEIVPVEIGFSGDVPVSRGLGSSSSLIVGGVYGANHFLKKPLSNDELLKICVEMEGHPDNVAPAIVGGLVASYKIDNGYRSIRYDVDNSLKFTVIIPPFELETEKARGVLPKILPYSDIVNNLSRIINIPLAFKNGDINMLKELFNDKLHEPYRAPLIKGYDEIKDFLKDKECAFAISGSGSTMIAIHKDENLEAELKKFGYEVKTLSVGNGVSVKEV